MIAEKFRWLAAVIAAHSDGRVVGRTRLQKTIKLLQSFGFPTDYTYTIHFYGPYSEDVQADIGLLEGLGLLKEEPHSSSDGNTYYTLQLVKTIPLPDIQPYRKFIDLMQSKNSVVLELAATYKAFLETGSSPEVAVQRLRQKKGAKCANGAEAQAISLLDEMERIRKAA